jgi:hypothetical protein
VLLAQTNLVQWVSAGKDVANSVQSVATVLAITIGGIWTYRRFVKGRGHLPKASTQLDVSFWRLPDERRLVRAALTIKNEGDVLLKIPSGYIWIQQMKPWPDEVISNTCSKLEMPWPLVEERDIKSAYEIEPKESEIVQMDFVIPDIYTQVLVYSHLKNGAKSGNIGWITSTVIDFEQEEKNEKHTIMSNEKGEPLKRQGPAKEKPKPAQIQTRPKEQPKKTK